MIDSWAQLHKINTNIYLFGDSIRKHTFENNSRLFTDQISSLDGIKKT